VKIIILIFAFLGVFGVLKPAWGGERIPLPAPRERGQYSLEEVLIKRRSVRSFRNKALTLEELSQLLFAAQGITEKRYGFRTAPSAGALYPLEVYVVVGKVEGIPEGVYHYLPREHALEMVLPGDKREDLFRSALYQEAIKEAPVTIVICAVYERTTRKYGERGIRYVHMEAGHAGQNIYLQAEALDLGTVAIGAFYDEAVARVLDLPRDVVPLYLFPVGKR